MKYIPQFGPGRLRIAILSLRSIGRFLPQCCGDGGEEVWRTASGTHTGTRCSRSEAGGEAWWWREGCDRPGRRMAAGANGRPQRNMELNGWSATLRLLQTEEKSITHSHRYYHCCLGSLQAYHMQCHRWQMQKNIMTNTNVNRACVLTLTVCAIRRRQ